MPKTLQEVFVDSHGQPVMIDNLVVRQMDRLPMHGGKITVCFTGGKKNEQGVRLKCKGGWIELSDGRRVETVDIWRDIELPDIVQHGVNCPTGELAFWNIYRLHHPDGTVTEDMWTGNAGMVLISEQPMKKAFACSDGYGPFDPNDLAFEISSCSGPANFTGEQM